MAACATICLQVAPHGRLAAGEMQLQHAELGRLRQHVEPDFASAARRRRAPARAGWSNRGIAADSDASARPAGRSAPRSARRRCAGGAVTLTPSPRPCRRAPAAWPRCRPGCAPWARCRCCASSAAIASTLRTPSHSCSTATAMASGANTRSGARIVQRSRAASWRSLTCARERRLRGRPDHDTRRAIRASLMRPPDGRRRAGSAPA